MNSIQQNITNASMEEPTKELLSSKVEDRTGKSLLFDRKETIRLIECVRKQPKLWHRQYIRKRLSSGVSEWENIQRNEFPYCTVHQLKTRWKTMRDSFRRESKRIECGECTKSLWPLYERMLFLDGHFRLRKTLKHKVSQSYAKAHATSSKSKEWVAIQSKKEASELAQNCSSDVETTVQTNERKHQQPVSCSTSGDPNDASCGISEVTYSKKFRSRLQSEPVTKITEEGWNIREPRISNGQFLMSLVPFLNILPLDKNLEIRLKLLQLIANATQLENVSENKLLKAKGFGED